MQGRESIELAANEPTPRTALADFQESITRFNERWRELLACTDLTEVNQRRDEYNRWYVFEKE